MKKWMVFGAAGALSLALGTSVAAANYAGQYGTYGHDAGRMAGHHVCPEVCMARMADCVRPLAEAETANAVSAVVRRNEPVKPAAVTRSGKVQTDKPDAAVAMQESADTPYTDAGDYGADYVYADTSAGYNEYCNYADVDDDGVCDNYSDADDDGVCDNSQGCGYGSGYCGYGGGNGGGNGYGGGHHSGGHHW